MVMSILMIRWARLSMDMFYWYPEFLIACLRRLIMRASCLLFTWLKRQLIHFSDLGTTAWVLLLLLITYTFRFYTSFVHMDYLNDYLIMDELVVNKDCWFNCTAGILLASAFPRWESSNLKNSNSERPSRHTSYNFTVIELSGSWSCLRGGEVVEGFIWCSC